jgi:hypothetical protein
LAGNWIKATKTEEMQKKNRLERKKEKIFKKNNLKKWNKS